MLTAEFRRRTNLTRDAVRLYVQLGLLRPTVDPGNGYQHFTGMDVERAGMIRMARELGFSLKQMVPLAREYEAGGLSVKRRLAVMRQQLAMIEAQATRVAAMRDYVRAKIAWLEAGAHGDEPAFAACARAMAAPAASGGTGKPTAARAPRAAWR
jgi:DNA-binding transcriptional MerR regulator